MGNVNWKTAPRGKLALAHNRPPCPSTIERQIDSPRPKYPEGSKLKRGQHHRRKCEKRYPVEPPGAHCQAKLIRRQAEARAHFENGQSIPAQVARGGARARRRPSPSDPGDAGVNHFLTIDDRVELPVVANIRPHRGHQNERAAEQFVGSPGAAACHGHHDVELELRFAAG